MRRLARALRGTRHRHALVLERVATVLRDDPQWLLAAARAIRTDPDRCTAVAARSYWHPNGFAKIKMFERDDFSLRLHIWPAGADRRGDMNPHGHRWAFASWLFTGHGLVEKRFTAVSGRDPAAVPHVRCRYRPGRGPGGLRRSRAAHLRLTQEFVHRRGEVYSCTTDVVHTVDPMGTSFMATVVLQGPTTRRCTPVYLRPGRSQDEQYRPFDPTEVRDLLHDLEAATCPTAGSTASRRNPGLVAKTTYRGVLTGATVYPRRSVPGTPPGPTPPDNPYTRLCRILVGSDLDIRGLRTAATRLRDESHRLREALLALSADDAAVDEVVARSSVHANGFAKIVLHSAADHSVRLHVWDRRNGRWVPDSMPHGHRWEFASWIVLGALHETTFVEALGGVRFERHAYSRNADGSYRLRQDGEALLQRARWFVRRAGTVYTRQRSVTHTATPDGEGLVASLVMQGPRRFDPTPVYVRPGTQPDHDEWSLSQESLRALLSSVAEAIR